MKQVYLTPKSSVVKAQLRATLLAGSGTGRSNVPGGGSTNGFDTRERRLFVD